MTGVAFRPYTRADETECIAIFDANCPGFFAPGERDAYAAFLDRAPAGYEVCEVGGRVLGAFGLFGDGDRARTLHWILLDPGHHGRGLGSSIMQRVVRRARDSGATRIDIAASQKSAAFFTSFGAESISTREHGWGPGMHRVDMTISL